METCAFCLEDKYPLTEYVIQDAYHIICAVCAVNLIYQGFELEEVIPDSKLLHTAYRKLFPNIKKIRKPKFKVRMERV